MDNNNIFLYYILIRFCIDISKICCCVLYMRCRSFNRNTKFKVLESFNRNLGGANIKAHPIIVNRLHDQVKEETREIQHIANGFV